MIQLSLSLFYTLQSRLQKLCVVFCVKEPGGCLWEILHNTFFRSFSVFYVCYFYGQLGLSVHTAVSSVNGRAAGSTRTWVSAPADSSLQLLSDMDFLALQNKKGPFLIVIQHPGVFSQSSSWVLEQSSVTQACFSHLGPGFTSSSSFCWPVSCFPSWLSCWAAAVRVIWRFLVAVLCQAYLSQEHYLEIWNKWRSSSSSILKQNSLSLVVFLLVR